MKTLFQIGELGKEDKTLLCEIGEHYCCLGTIRAAGGPLTSLRYLTRDDSSPVRDTRFLDELDFHPSRFEKVVICSSFPQAMLVPHRYFNSLVSGDTFFEGDTHQLYDVIPEWQLMNLYFLQTYLYTDLQQRFPGAEYMHAYSPALKVYNGFIAECQISVHFQTKGFRVIVKKNQQLHLVQTYPYETALDVVYFLLKICYDFDLPQGETQLVLSGLIEEKSDLYTELRSYFLNLEFAVHQVTGLNDSPYPKHFFTSMYNLAACVS